MSRSSRNVVAPVDSMHSQIFVASHLSAVAWLTKTTNRRPVLPVRFAIYKTPAIPVSIGALMYSRGSVT